MKAKITFVALFASLAMATLSGCTAVAVGTATYATTNTVGTVTDRRTTGRVIDDNTLQAKVSKAIDEKIGQDVDYHLTVTAYNQCVLLSGEIANAEAKAKAGEVAKAMPEVKKVYNELKVHKNATFSEKMSDISLATKVRTRIVGNQEAKLNQMKIVVERGVVYLMGVLTVEENRKACQVAASTSGVTRVVSCVEIAK